MDVMNFNNLWLMSEDLISHNCGAKVPEKLLEAYKAILEYKYGENYGVQ